MKIITNQGDYGTVIKEKTNFYEVRYDNGKCALIEKHRCEILIPESVIKANHEELNLTRLKLAKSYEKHRMLCVNIQGLKENLEEELKRIQNINTCHSGGFRQGYNKVINKLKEILK